MSDSIIFYEVIDSQGDVVRRDPEILTVDDLGRATISYETLADLPVGEYTIVPGDIPLEIRPAAR